MRLTDRGVRRRLAGDLPAVTSADVDAAWARFALDKPELRGVGPGARGREAAWWRAVVTRLHGRGGIGMLVAGFAVILVAVLVTAASLWGAGSRPSSTARLGATDPSPLVLPTGTPSPAATQPTPPVATTSAAPSVALTPSAPEGLPAGPGGGAAVGTGGPADPTTGATHSAAPGATSPPTRAVVQVSAGVGVPTLAPAATTAPAVVATTAAAPTAPTAPARAATSAPATPTSSPTPTPSPTGPTFTETTGGAANTWSDYSDAGGEQGPTIKGGQAVQIRCVVQGFQVADGNTNWYRIASAPWSDAYYASADAFYNNGATSGSLNGSPYVDPAVPDC